MSELLRTCNRLVAVLRLMADDLEHAMEWVLVSEQTRPPLPGSVPVPITTPLGDRQDPARPRCPICHEPLLLCEVLPQGEDTPRWMLPPPGDGSAAYIWRCVRAPHTGPAR